MSERRRCTSCNGSGSKTERVAKHATHVVEADVSTKLMIIAGNIAILAAAVVHVMKVKWCNAGAVVVLVTHTNLHNRFQ